MSIRICFFGAPWDRHLDLALQFQCLLWRTDVIQAVSLRLGDLRPAFQQG